MLTEATASVRSATSFIPCAWVSLSEMSSRTLIPISWIEGKESTGIAFFTGASRRSQSHFFISRFILCPPLFQIAFPPCNTPENPGPR